MNLNASPLLLCVAAMAAGAPLAAQDMRTVREPVIPATCVALKSAFTNTAAVSGDIEAGLSKVGRDTGRIQQALDHCAKGHAVELTADGESAAFLGGPIFLRPGVTLLIDKGVTLYGSRDPRDYEISKGSCGLVSDQPPGCHPLITGNQASGSGIMGEGAIDGQGGAKLIVDGKPGPTSWWDLAEDARAGGRQQVPRMIDTDHSDDFTLYRITLRNSANFHVVFHHGNGFTAWGVKIDTPKTARNTDGIDPAGSRNITVTQSYIRTGDDNIAIKGGDAPTRNMSVTHNHFYWGHGMSIGSETDAGVSEIRVEDLSLDGPDNGIRIKSNASRGGVVRDVVYDDVCIRNSKYPVLFDTAYTLPGKTTQSIPVYEQITLRKVRISGGGKIQFNGFDKEHRIGVTLDGVLLLDGQENYRLQASHADLTFGPGPVNLPFAGDDLTTTGKQAGGNLPGCAAMFVPFP
jgi:polygalacturonase